MQPLFWPSSAPLQTIDVQAIGFFVYYQGRDDAEEHE